MSTLQDKAKTVSWTFLLFSLTFTLFWKTKVHNVFVLPFVFYCSELVTLPEEIIFSYIVYYIHTLLSL
jgi:hypothetical protein